MPLQQVHLRVNDAGTGKPTPVRLRVTGADGVYYVPHGRLTEFTTGVNQEVGGNVMTGAKAWVYIDGTCEILLPPGTLRIEIAKGPEYRPVDEEITLLAGKMALRFTIERWSDVRGQGWYSGDSRAHFLSPDAALLEGEAEDLALVSLLAKEISVRDSFGKAMRAIPNLLAFSGQSFARQTPGCAVAVGTQNLHPELGSLALLHSHRVVFPLTSGGPDQPDDWNLDDWCDQCHRKKGLVVWTDLLHETADFLYGESLANAILGKIDALELTFWEDSPFDALPDFYRLLDAEIVLPLVGASGKESNGVLLGGMRTYAHLGTADFNLGSWVEAVRAGQTFVSNGPLLDFTMNGVLPSANLEVTPTNPLRARVEARSMAPFEQLELLWNGEVIAAARADAAAPCQAVLEHEWIPTTSGWLAARCRGETLLPSRPGPQRVFAHTSAVAVRLAGSPRWAKPTAVQHLLKQLDAMLRWGEENARCDPAQRQRLCHVFEEARNVLRERVSS